MKRYFIIAVLLSLAGGSGLFLWRKSADNFIKEPLPVAAEPKAASLTKQETPSKNLKAEALQLLAKNPIVGDQVSGAEKNQITEKVASLKKILADNFLNFQAWIDLANYYKFAEDYNGALAMLNFAVKLQPTNFLAFHNLGDLYGFYLKDSAKAEDNFLKSLQYNPRNIDAYLELSSLYRSGYQGRTNSETLLSAAAQKYPNDPNFPILLGQYYEENNRPAEALASYQRAFKLLPSDKSVEEEIQNLKIQLGLN